MGSLWLIKMPARMINTVKILHKTLAARLAAAAKLPDITLKLLCFLISFVNKPDFHIRQSNLQEKISTLVKSNYFHI